jgi:Protein of unknown function (DUF2934)
LRSFGERHGNTELQATSTQAETGDVSVGNSARDEEISRRAYEICLERGEQPGRELDDWLQAERELQAGPLRRASEGHRVNALAGLADGVLALLMIPKLFDTPRTVLAKLTCAVQTQ